MNIANGKGSLWCVDPEYRPNLIQALKKQHFPTAHAFCTPPASPPSASSPPRHLVLQDQSCSLKESDIDAATAMMLLNSAPGQHADRCKKWQALPPPRFVTMRPSNPFAAAPLGSRGSVRMEARRVLRAAVQVEAVSFAPPSGFLVVCRLTARR
ncbi:hypothetical protein Z043_123690 [Scleropages formosus]|uniref:Fork-head domain-containing protein n=1 Tax=Scleropages formosus TaxID=113540 RepID=A0A0P7TX21_SCLFO|nr:hypothetical protein Z043_123690 [Scleropages formosus]